MAIVNEVKTIFTADNNDFINKVNQNINKIDDLSKKTTNWKINIDFSTSQIDTWKINQDIRAIKQQIKSAIKQWDLNLELKLTSDLENLKNSLNEAKRQAKETSKQIENESKVKLKLELDENRLVELKNKLNDFQASSIKIKYEETGLPNFVRDTWKALTDLQKQSIINLIVKSWNLKEQIDQLKEAEKLAKKLWQTEVAIKYNRQQFTLWKELTEAQAKITNLVNKWNADLSRFRAPFLALWQSLSWLSWNFGDAWSAVSWFGNILWAVWWPIWLFVAWASALIWALVWLWDKLEQTRIWFKVMTWSAQEADSLLKELSIFSSKTPFTITQSRDAATQLIAYWIAVKDIIPTLTTLWNASRWNSDLFGRLTYAFWQVRASWKLMGTELRQITETWLPLLPELARLTGKNVKDLAWNIADANISFDTFNQALTNIAGKEWWKFFGLMNEQSKTLSWQISNIKDSFIIMWEKIGTVLLPAFKGIAWWVKFFADNLNIIWPILLWIWGIVWVAFAPVITLLSAVAWLSIVVTNNIDWIWLAFQNVWIFMENFFKGISNWFISAYASLDNYLRRLNWQEEIDYWKFKFDYTEYEKASQTIWLLEEKITWIKSSINDLNSDFKNWKISVEEYTRKHSELSVKLTENETLIKKNAVAYNELKKENEDLIIKTDAARNVLKELVQQREIEIKKSWENSQSVQNLNKKIEIWNNILNWYIKTIWQNAIEMDLLTWSQEILNRTVENLNTAKSQEEFNKLKQEAINTANWYLKVLEAQNLITWNLDWFASWINRVSAFAQNKINWLLEKVWQLNWKNTWFKVDIPKVTWEWLKNFFNNINPANTKINEFKKTLDDIWKKKFEPIKDTLKPWAWAWATKKSPEEIQAEKDKKAQEEVIKTLEAKRESMIKQTTETIKDEELKAKRIIEINDFIDKEINKSKDKWSKNEVEKAKETIKRYEDLKESVKKAYEWVNESIDKSKDKITKYNEDIAKTKDKFIETSKSIQKEIEDINKSLENLWQDKSNKLIDRAIQIKDELNWLNEKSSEWLTTEESTKRQRLLIEQEQIKNQWITQEQIDTQEAKSPTDKILEDFEKEKLALEEKKVLKQEELKQKEKDYNIELELLESQKAKETSLLEEYEKQQLDIKKLATEEEIKLEREKQSALDDTIGKLREIAVLSWKEDLLARANQLTSNQKTINNITNINQKNDYKLNTNAWLNITSTIIKNK